MSNIANSEHLKNQNRKFKFNFQFIIKRATPIIRYFNFLFHLSRNYNPANQIKNRAIEMN